MQRWHDHQGDPVAMGLRQDYLQRCATVGQLVRVQLPGQPELLGTAVDVDAEGRLVVLADGQRTRWQPVT